ncbi:hypothetical protein GCM10008908_00360 [Clostridium subterminale]|uniref:Uncharacterized protein n=1 Tax=Clostridium subterminale TaxID=1550 RepID=A0ABN1KET7_CLOSU
MNTICLYLPDGKGGMNERGCNDKGQVLMLNDRNGVIMCLEQMIEI